MFKIMLKDIFLNQDVGQTRWEDLKQKVIRV